MRLPLVFLLLAVGIGCSANPLAVRETTAPFKIYAYGKGISGLPVFYKDVAYSTESSNTWIASPDSTERSAPFSANVLCLNQDTASANPVSFSGTSEVGRSNKLTNVWSLYGSYVLVTLDKANFYAKPTGTDGLYSLLWSTSAEEMTDSIPLTLRTIAPATASVLA
ncbi:uncharacterized protein N7506_011282 [Penicillium brevicompactum]|uniref:uncharacterized protein n=1 Tax=Penicillium brevicompactum TaxID=5074 RepID=UPI0025402805|nr:uncharacterized protein N7506_011282 [Penicillium brevicompactum]KAJ5322152.1 hypothetical protein N7506_011282 [Penicillium brevicompactum]